MRLLAGILIGLITIVVYLRIRVAKRRELAAAKAAAALSKEKNNPRS